MAAMLATLAITVTKDVSYVTAMNAKRTIIISLCTVRPVRVDILHKVVCVIRAEVTV